MSFFIFHPPNLSKKSLPAQQDQFDGRHEIWQYINEHIISCVRVALCRPGAFAFLWGCFGPCWPEVIPRCRSPPPSFWSLANHQPKRRSIWLLSICGTITRFIHRIASWRYRTKLLKCSKNLTARRLLTGCVHTAIKPTIPLIGMMGWSMRLSLSHFRPMKGC